MNKPNDPSSERIILGIDPGTNVLGYGLISVKGKEVKMIAMGVIDLRKVADIYLKLGRIYERVMSIIDSFKPDELSIEAPFFGKNVQSMLKLGRAQGVVIAAAISRQIPIHEYAPMAIKQAITGKGSASKEQVAGIMKSMLNISDESMLPYLDATDALAAAYCHHINTMKRGVKNSIPAAALHSQKAPKSKSASWADFVTKNSDRIHKS